MKPKVTDAENLAVFLLLENSMAGLKQDFFLHTSY